MQLSNSNIKKFNLTTYFFVLELNYLFSVVSHLLYFTARNTNLFYFYFTYKLFNKTHYSALYDYNWQSHNVCMNFEIEPEIVPNKVTPLRKSKIEFSKLNNKLPLLLNVLLLNFNWSSNYHIANPNFQRYVLKADKLAPIINPTVFTHHWSNLFNFITNFFLFCDELLTFSTPFFKKETAAFNWYFNKFELNFWRLHSNYFCRQIINFNQLIEFFYQKLYDFGCETAIITDPIYHAKSLFYLNKNYFFSLGLADASTDPTLLSLAIPVLQVNFFSQFFFIKYISWGYIFSSNFQYKNLVVYWKYLNLNLQQIKRF